jgi:PhnB protein
MDQSSKFPYREMPSIAPFLFVRDGARAVEFYKLALGAEEMFRTANPDSMLVHLSVGRADFWVADEEPEHQNLSLDSLGCTSVRMVLVVEDPDSAFERAVSAGATVVWPVADQSYGWRLGPRSDTTGRSASPSLEAPYLETHSLFFLFGFGRDGANLFRNRLSLGEEQQVIRPASL